MKIKKKKLFLVLGAFTVVLLMLSSTTAVNVSQADDIKEQKTVQREMEKNVEKLDEDKIEETREKQCHICRKNVISNNNPQPAGKLAACLAYAAYIYGKAVIQGVPPYIIPATFAFIRCMLVTVPISK